MQKENLYMDPYILHVLLILRFFFFFTRTTTKSLYYGGDFRVDFCAPVLIFRKIVCFEQDVLGFCVFTIVFLQCH